MSTETTLTYQAENEIWMLPEARAAREPITIEEARRISEQLLGPGYFVVPYGTLRDFFKRYILHTDYQSGLFHAPTANRAGYVSVDLDTGTFVLLHELAHAKAYVAFGSMSHDGRFRGCYVALVRSMYGDIWADALAKNFRRHGLVVAGTRQDVVV